MKLKYYITLLTTTLGLACANGSDNLSLGIPSKSGQIIDREGYAFCYSEKHEQPMWVSYKLTKNEVKNKVAKRKDNFRSDPVIKTGSATLKDYASSGYDRGHLAPAADMAWSKKAMSESFFLTNMSPQKPGLNRGMWKDLESHVRNWSLKDDELYVITGPIIRKGFKTIGKNKVTVPQWYYKIVVDVKGPEKKAIAFIMPNRKPQKSLKSFVVSIDKVEQVTGLNFLNNLQEPLQKKLEASSDPSLWFLDTKKTKKSTRRTVAKSSSGQYWLNTNSGTRHNKNCKSFKNTKKGRLCGKSDGKACRSCGG